MGLTDEEYANLQIVEIETDKPGFSSATGTIWLAVLTLVVFILMAVSFRRWRFDYCRGGLRNDMLHESKGLANDAYAASEPSNSRSASVIDLDLHQQNIT